MLMGFIGCPPKIAPYQIVHPIKGASSRILRQEFPELYQITKCLLHIRHQQ